MKITNKSENWKFTLVGRVPKASPKELRWLNEMQGWLERKLTEKK